jgi:acyl-coenzyme A thioesterase PaaI-like protein
MQNELGPDDPHNIFNPFYSPDLKTALDADWSAKRDTAYAIRELIASLVTCTSDAEVLQDVTALIQQQSEKLKQGTRHLGRMAYLDAEPEKYQTMASVGYELNPLDGECNPIAAPMKLWIDGDVAYGRVNMNWQYEGPPNSVHGGFVAALFDQFLGVAQKMTGEPGVTGGLNVRYIKPTPLCQELKLIGRVHAIEGRKNILHGELWAGDELTATCEAIFIRINRETYLKMRNAIPKN